MQAASHDEAEWLHAHVHEPNPVPPSLDAGLSIYLPDQTEHRVTIDDLRTLPLAIAAECLIVSTGHGVSGPFAFGGARLSELVQAYLAPNQCWEYADVVSADGFGNRVSAGEAQGEDVSRPILLAYQIDDRPLRRDEGLVRLIVPAETEDALRQVKWVAGIYVR